MPTGINYNNRVFTALSNSSNGQVSSATRFHYREHNGLISADYAGGAIVRGQILGRKLPDNSLEFLYQHIDENGRLCSGRCTSQPELLPDGRLRLDERWQWLHPESSAGHSVIEELLKEQQ